MLRNWRITRRSLAALVAVGILVAWTPVHAQSVWDGGGADNNWGTAANWVGNAVPPFPTELTFTGGTRLAPNNNLTNPVVRRLSFDAAAGAFTLGGNAFTIGEEATADYRVNGIINADGDTQIINNNLTLSRGQHTIATTGAGGLTLNGTFTRSPGVGVRFEPTLNTPGAAIKTTLTNVNGILGGWATIRNPQDPPAFLGETLLFAKVNAMGEVVPYLDYTAADDIDGFGAETTFPAGTTGASNIRWFGGADLSNPNVGITSLNTFLFEEDFTRTFDIGAGNTLRFSHDGGIFRNRPTGQQNSEDLRFTNGSVTAGSSASPATLNLWSHTSPGPDPVIDPGEQHNFNIHFNTTNITDNPEGGAVTVVKNGIGGVRTSAAGHTFSGGLYINRGVWRVQSNNAVGFGLGDVHVAGGAQAYINSDGAAPNDFYITGKGVDEGSFQVGALRIAADGGIVDGDVILTSDARFGNRGAQARANELGVVANQGAVINGKITGNFNLEMSMENDQGAPNTVFNTVQQGPLGSDMPTMILTNSANDWTGNTTLGRGRLRIGGTGEVIPDGPGKGNLTLVGEVGGNIPVPTVLSSPTILTLDSKTETINGLFSGGVLVDPVQDPVQLTNHNLVVITNSTLGEGRLRVGNNNATSTYGGVIVDHNGFDAANMPILGTVRLDKIGSGTLTLTGANNYSGETNVEGGVLSMTNPFLHNASDVRISAGAVLDLNFGLGNSDTIDSLFLGGVPQAPGTYGGTGSGAGTISPFFTGLGTLTVTTLGSGGSPPGDFDGDGDVDSADLTEWRADFGNTAGSDADSDGDSDGNDFLIWQQNLGTDLTPTVPAAGSVPEPTAISLLALASLGMVAATRRRR